MRFLKTIMVLLSVTIAMTGFAHTPAYDVGPPVTEVAFIKKDVVKVETPATVVAMQDVNLAAVDVGYLDNSTVYVKKEEEVLTPSKKASNAVFIDRHRRIRDYNYGVEKSTTTVTSSEKFIDRHRRSCSIV